MNDWIVERKNQDWVLEKLMEAIEQKVKATRFNSNLSSIYSGQFLEPWCQRKTN